MSSYAKVYPEESFFIVPGKGSGSTWSSTHGYNMTIRQEAAVLKANTRKMKEEQEKTIKIIKNTNMPTEPEACCVII